MWDANASTNDTFWRKAIAHICFRGNGLTPRSLVSCQFLQDILHSSLQELTWQDRDKRWLEPESM